MARQSSLVDEIPSIGNETVDCSITLRPASRLTDLGLPGEILRATRSALTNSPDPRNPLNSGRSRISPIRWSRRRSSICEGTYRSSSRHDRAKDDVLLPVGIDQVNCAVRHQLDDAFSDRSVDIVGRHAGGRAAAIASAPVRAILPSSLSRASISIVEILVASP